jgi:hypothetical protein
LADRRVRDDDPAVSFGSAQVGFDGRNTVGRHRAEPWWVSAARVARLGGEQDKAHVLDRSGHAEEPPEGQALLMVPPDGRTLMLDCRTKALGG